MKLLPLVIFIGLITTLRAQFYCPELPWHDISQRVFTIEAARILQAFDSSSNHPSLKWSSRTTEAAGGGIVIGVTWLRDSAVIGTTEARYQESDLCKGAEFYRLVFRQLLTSIPPSFNLPKAGATTGSPLANSYWQGAAEARPSRLATCQALSSFAKARGLSPSEPEDQAKLAGLLTHGALPVLAGQKQLDALWLARAAAWACLAEHTSGTLLPDSTWSPVLALSGRWPLAAAGWTTPSAGASAIESGWSALFKYPAHPRALLECVLETETGLMQIPIHCYASLLSYDCADISDEFLSSQPKKFAHHYSDYLPDLIHRTGVSGGAFLWNTAAHLHQASITLKDTQILPSATPTQRLALGQSGLKLALASQSQKSPLPTLLKAATPLLEVGLASSSEDHLSPIYADSLTVADLHSYIWESTCQQLAAHYNYYENSFGDHATAQSFLEMASAHCPSIRNYVWAKDKNPRVLKHRARARFSGNWVPAYHDMRLNFSKKPEEERIPWMMKCRWLDREAFWTIANYLTSKPYLQPQLPPELLERLMKEGGTYGYSMLSNFNTVGWPLRKMLSTPRLAKPLALLLPPDAEKIAASQYQKAVKLGTWPAVAALRESQAWQEVDADFVKTTLDAYLYSGDLAGFIRFTKESEALDIDAVGWSNDFMSDVWYIGHVTGDKELCQYALRRGSTYSAIDLSVRIRNALASGDIKNASALIQAREDRYTPNASLSRLREFLPRWTSLKDETDPQHEESLDFLKKTKLGLNFMWLLYEKSHLSPEKGLRFLVNEATNVKEIPLLEALLKNDAPGYIKAYQRFFQTSLHGPHHVIQFLGISKFQYPSCPPSTSQKPSNFEPWRHKLERLASTKK